MASVDPYLEEYSEGVREIATSVSVMMARAKQKSTDLFMVFLELEDPYDNIAHSAVLEAIRTLPMATMVQHFVMEGHEVKRPDHGIKNSIRCKMSRMVMALCINPILMAIDQSKGFPINSRETVACKAFVEKLILIATTEDDMKEHLRKVGDLLTAIGLEKIDKNNCRYVAMTFDKKQMSVKNDLDFKLADQDIRGVQWKESWTFLGKTFEI